MTLILNKIFQYTPYDIIINIIDFNDEDKYYNKAGHKEKMNDVFIDIKNMARIFGVDINASLLIPPRYAKSNWGWEPVPNELYTSDAWVFHEELEED